MEERKRLKTKPLSTREKAVLFILDSEYQKFAEHTYRDLDKCVLKQIQIAERWANQQNKAYNLKETDSGSMTKRSLKSGVSRAIMDLIGRNAIVEVNGGYLISNIHTRCFKHKKDLFSQVHFLDEDLCRIYDGVYAIKVEETDLDNAKEIFYNILGAETCFSINRWDNLLIIMLRGSDEETVDIMCTIAEVINDVYEEQQTLSQKASLR